MAPQLIAPLWIVSDYDNMTFLDLRMSQKNIYNNLKESDLFKFYKKYFLRDFDFFKRKYNEKVEQSFLEKIINKRPNFIVDSFEYKNLYYLYNNSISLLNSSDMDKHYYLKERQDFFFEESNIINEKAFNYIKAAFKELHSEIEYIISSDPVEIISNKVENF